MPGPERSSDQATIGSAKWGCTMDEKPKFADDDIVLTKSIGKYWARQDNACLSQHNLVCHPSDETNFVEANSPLVNCFAHAVPSAGILCVSAEC